MSEVRDQDAALPFTDPIATLRAALRGRYEIERQIGQGAFATVYLARDLKHERKVAIKVLNADPESETGEIRFIREIRVVARLQHPNILPLHDSGHVEAMLYYVMPYVVGETLRIRMHRERQMGVDAAVGIARETADALAYAHSQGVIHRDIKPENILLSGSHAIVADFGIARAIDVGGVKQLTMTGVAGPGTPAYMSPEQLLGDRVVDARSDIYSLGCVLYEMLAGKPPFPGKDGFVKRFTEPPPHISSLRRDAPPWLDSVVAKSLAKDPDDRYVTAGDFVAALAQPVSVRTPHRGKVSKHALASPPLFESDPLEAQEFAAAFPESFRSTERKRREPLVPVPLPWRDRWLAAARSHPVRSGLGGVALLSLVLVAVAGAKRGAFPSIFGADAPLDSTRYVILASTGIEHNVSAIGLQVADSVYDAFTRWEGLPVVPQATVAQAIADGASPPATEAAAVSLARRLGAGRAVWVEAFGPSQPQRVRIHLYDAASGESLHDFSVPPSRGEAFFVSAAQRLLGMADRPPAAIGCDGLTRNFPAWSACSRGHIELTRGNIAAAEVSFREAVSSDPLYAPARLWLAQVLGWRSPSRRSEAYELARGARESIDLIPRDSLVAAGLTAFLEQRYPAACAAYSEMTKSDSSDFAGWYGLGECQSADSAVVRSYSSVSGWAFRSSWHSAVGSYLNALRIQPGAHEIFSAGKLQALMPVSATITRIGSDPGRQRFAAFPTVESGDTIGFVPYPTNTFARIERTTAADAALRKNRNLLDTFAADWAERFPLSFRAQEARADALEAKTDLGSESPRASAILRAIDSAITLTAKAPGEPAQQHVTRLRARKVRIHFKRGEFATARILADSILGTPPIPGSESDLYSVAGLIGRADLAAGYWERTFRSHTLTGETVPPAIANPASRYFAYAATGICGPQLANVRQRFDSALQDYVTGDIRDAVRADLSDRAALLAAPCTSGKS
ncbi:MAG: serine/threonine-protein kinase, partial [Gemmatimonadaceae bacterium]